MATFVISNLYTANFTFEGITFQKLNFKIPVEEQWANDHCATFKALADDNLNVEPRGQKTGLAALEWILKVSFFSNLTKYDIATQGLSLTFDTRL